MTNLLDIDLTAITAVEARKLGAAIGIKGASKGKKADLLQSLTKEKAAQLEDKLAREAREAAEAAPVAVTEEPKKGMCNVCGKRRAVKSTNGQCGQCFEEGGWENTHNDGGHEGLDLANLTKEQAEEVHGCWICYPELNRAQVFRTGRSRAGMVIVAKGTEIHKSQTFRKAAEAAGWTVIIQTETYELGDDAEGEGTRHYATARKGTESMSLAWDGRAYDYPSSSAVLNGKDRKVRNLKEALRLL